LFEPWEIKGRMYRTRAMAVLWLVCLSIGAAAVSGWRGSSVIFADGLTVPVPTGVIRDPGQIVGPDACAECHEKEHRVWMDSAHQADSQTLTRDAEAKRIAKAMGVRRIKTDARCASCHYTVQQIVGKRPKSISGVSCESCHSAGAGWIDPHAQFGDGAETALDETDQHRAERYQYCESMGMIHPAKLYGLASACYSCHTITDRELIEVGGHPTGEDFELVCWSQGDIRHNFIRDGADSNPASSPERQRVMYLIGAAVRLEYGLRAATSGGPSGTLLSAIEHLEAIHAVQEIDAVGRLIEIGKEAASVDGADYADAIGRVRVLGQGIETGDVGADVVEIDDLIPAIVTRGEQ